MAGRNGSQLNGLAQGILRKLPMGTPDDYTDALEVLNMTKAALIVSSTMGQFDEGSCRIMNHNLRRLVKGLRGDRGQPTNIVVPEKEDHNETLT